MSKRGRRGFQQAGGLMTSRIRAGAEARGFARVRLLTHWAEIAGAEIAQTTKPVKISHPKGGMGATLTLLCPGAHAPLIQMQIPQILKRINGVYGYGAIQRIRLTQTAATGFAEDDAAEFGRRAPKSLTAHDEAVIADQMSGIGDDGLKTALENLARNVKSKH